LCEPLVGRQLLEQPNDPLEKCNRLGAPRAVRGKTGRPQGVVASAMFRPLMLPELLSFELVVDPVSFHKRPRVACALLVQEVADVMIVTAAVAVAHISAIAVIRPKTMNCPAVMGPNRRVSIPELCLKQQSPWVLVTTTVLISWIRDAAGLRYIYATARGERFVEEDPRCVEHRGILRGYHSDRRAGEDRKECEHGVV